MQSNDSLFIDTSFIIYFTYGLTEYLRKNKIQSINLLLSGLEGQGIVVPAVGHENVNSFQLLFQQKLA